MIEITVSCVCGAFDRVGRLLDDGSDRYDLPRALRVAPLIESVTTMATEWAAHAATDCHAACKHAGGASSFEAKFSVINDHRAAR